MAEGERESTFPTGGIHGGEIIRFRVVPGPTVHSATFVLGDEDHTLSNALSHVLLQRPETIFCGYSVPHPSEAFVHMRLQVIKGEGKPTAVQVFQKGLKDLSKICDILLESVPDVPRPSPTVPDLST
eukprot:97352_1